MLAVVFLFVIGRIEQIGDKKFDVAFPLKGHRDDVGAVAFSPDGSRIVTGGLDEKARIWDARTGSLVTTFKGSGHEL